MRFPVWLLLVALTAPGFASQASSAQSGAAAPVSRAFADGVAKYVDMVQNLESSVPAVRPTNESEEIADRQRQLTGVIAGERRGAHQGEIFTREVADQFRKIIRKAFQGSSGRAMRRTIRERDPVKAIVLKVNEVYPDDQPRTTMPPTLLSRLPVLPKELTYRIVGRALILQDTKTNLIVDFILKAIP